MEIWVESRQMRQAIPPLFMRGGLPYGSCYIGIRASGIQGALAYSPGYYRVNDIPVLEFVSPSEEGSHDDFATTQLNDAWDMDSTNDIDYTRHLTYMGIETVVCRQIIRAYTYRRFGFIFFIIHSTTLVRAGKKRIRFFRAFGIESGT